MDGTTLHLAEIASGVRIGRLSDEAVGQTKRRIVDAIACAAGAMDEPFCVVLRDMASRYSAKPGARVWCTGAVSSIEMAGFANGSAMRYLDLNDTFLGATVGHPSDMIPALIALAEGFATSGARLIEGIVAAYELYGSLCMATALGSKGFDQSTAAAIGAAGGASRLLGLDTRQTGNALSIALGSCINLYNVRCGQLSDWKACAGPNGARNGVFAALLARSGMTGPTAIFEGKGGLAEVLGTFDLSRATRKEPYIVETRLKAYPVCYHGQSAVDAAVELSHRIGSAGIARVQIDTYEISARMMGSDPSKWRPETRETADHSLPYSVAVALKTGRLTSADYLPERLRDPALIALMQKIEVQSAQDMTARYPAENATRISVTTTRGETLTAERSQPKGHPDNPMSQDELASKLTSLWPARLLAADRIPQILKIVRGLDAAPDIVALVDCLCQPQ